MLTSIQKEFYNENGFLKLEGLFDPKELDKLATEYEQLFEVICCQYFPSWQY